MLFYPFGYSRPVNSLGYCIQEYHNRFLEDKTQQYTCCNRNRTRQNKYASHYGKRTLFC